MDLRKRMEKMLNEKKGIEKKASKTVKINGVECEVEKGKYGNGRTAIQLIDMEDGIPYATCTINIPDIDLEENQVIIKNYSENEGILEILIEAGIVSEPIEYVRAGFAVVPICEILI